MGIEVLLAAEQSGEVSAGLSDKSGQVMVRGLAPGKYFLFAKHRGIESENRWIEVGGRSHKRIRRFDLHWADYSIVTREVSGALTGRVNGNTGNKIMDVVHAREAVQPGVSLRLDDLFGDRTFSTVSDSSGAFMFGSVPMGTYLMTIAGGQPMVGSRISEETNLVVDISQSFSRNFLPLQLKEGGCGGMGYELKTD